MLRFAVCDDDTEFLQNLSLSICDFLEKSGVVFELRSYLLPQNLWADFECLPFEIVLLDVVMPGETGVVLARRIFEKNSRTVLAFCHRLRILRWTATASMLSSMP